MLTMGRYTKENFDWRWCTAPNFLPQEFQRTPTCGEDAVITLTGKKFSIVQRKKYKKVLPIRDMVKLLRKRGYYVIPITVCMLTNHYGCFRTLTKDHVVLTCQVYYRGVASWSVCHNEQYWHNGQAYPPNALEFLTRPPIASYIVWHPKWASCQADADFFLKYLVTALKQGIISSC